MTQRRVVRVTLQNLSTVTRGFSLEPYGDHCDLRPDGIVHATWELPPSGELELEIAVTNDAVLVCDASKPMAELRPNKDKPGGEQWE